MTLSSVERTVLRLAALIGLLGPNGVFLYFAFFRPAEMIAAMRHPVALAFVLEAFGVTALLAWWFARRPLGRWGWPTFVALALIGGLGFGLPAFALINAQTERSSP